ncbi:hypothetical protein Golomagni_04607, partial [Golovinomyces magnicellulatus]
DMDGKGLSEPNVKWWLTSYHFIQTHIGTARQRILERRSRRLLVPGRFLQLSQVTMGSFIFTWEHPADEVYVTGTFDDWSKSERLEKTNTIFAKRVFLTNVSEKIYYKFVVDGNWITDHTAPQEKDESGNLNNVLTADRIIIQTFDSIGTMSGVTPESSSVPLAAAVPLEKGKKKEPDTLPGTFPETPAAEGGLSEYLMNPLSATEISTAPIIHENNDSLKPHSDIKPDGKDEKEQTFSVSPLPAFPGAVNPVSIPPGQKLPDYSTLTSDTLTSNVDLGKDEKEQTFSVSPLPAFPGAVNPVSIPPGQKLPDYSTLTSDTLTSAVDLGKESAKDNDFTQNFSQAPPSETTPVKSEDGYTVTNNRKEDSNINFPESSSAIESRMKEDFLANSTIQSAGPLSSTAEMAAGVPKIESSILPTGNVSSINFTSSSDPESKNEKEGSGVHDLSKFNNSVTPGQLAGETKTTYEMHPSKLASGTSDETIKAVNNSLKPEQNSNKVVNEEAASKNEEDKPGIKADPLSIGKSAPVIIPTGSVPQNLSQTVLPHTVTTVESSNIDRETKTSDSHVADESNDAVGNDKANKKKKRSSFFGKLKAKLTFKDKD